MKCECGFEFTGPGEYRNCQAFVTSHGDGGIVCPDCGNCYVKGVFIGKEEQVMKPKDPK